MKCYCSANLISSTLLEERESERERETERERERERESKSSNAMHFVKLLNVEKWQMTNPLYITKK